MTLPGFRGTTYEVLTGDGGRWIIAQIFRVEKDARGLAETLLASGEHPKVRITAKRDGWSAEKVIFEAAGQVKDKPLKAFPVTAPPLCDTIEDCLRHPARLALGRLGRAYLDERGITAAEFLVSATDLVLVERRDPFFMNAVNLLARAQAEEHGGDPSDRVDVLFDLHEQLRDRARRDMDDGETLHAEVIKRGLAALPFDGPDSPPGFDVLACLARIVAVGGGWAGRLSKLLDLLETDRGGKAPARALIDELIAELLDGAQALTEILGGLRDGTEACANLTALATGGGKLPKYASEAAHRLHATMRRARLPATQGILLERVSRVLGGTKPLTQEGGDAERHAFTSLVPALIEPGGTLGGGPTAEAMTLRCKMALGHHEELTIREAIECLMELFPTRAVRLGYLLDLSPTPTGLKNSAAIRGSLAQLVAQLQSVRDLMPEGTPREMLIAVIHSLRARLAMDILPEEVRGALSSSLDYLLRGGVAPADGLEPGPAETPPREPLVRRDVADGRILFEEGDVGSEAYLITEGEVDIFRIRNDGSEEVIATLGSGEILGEMSLIDNQPRTVSARIRHGAEVIVISQDDLNRRLAKLAESDPLLKLLVDTLVRRLREQLRERA